MRNTNQSTGLRFFFIVFLVLLTTCATFVAPPPALADGNPIDPPMEDDSLRGSSDTLTSITPTPETVSDWEMLITLIDIII